MATIKERLAFVISADASDAIRAFDKTAQSARTELGKATASVESFAQKFQNNLKRAVVPATLVFSGLGAALGMATKSAVTDAKAQQILADQLVRSAGATESAVAANEKFIQSLMIAAAVTDDELRPAQAALVRATGDIAKSQDLLRLSTDIAVATNKDLETVSLAVAKAYNGQLGALRRLGIPLDDATMKSKDFDRAYAKLQQTFGGAASRAADTAAGQMKRMSITIEETKEAIGAALLPVVESFARALQPIAQFAMNNASAFTALALIAGTLAGSIIAVNVAMSAYNTLASLTKAINSALNTSFSTLKVSMGLVAGALAVAGFLYTALKGKTNDYKQSTDQLTAALKLEAGAQRAAIGELINSDKAFRKLVEAADKAGVSTDELTSAIERGGFAYNEVKRKIEDLYYVQQSMTGGANQALIRTLEGMRKQVLRTAEGFALANNQIRATAANFRMAEQSTWAAMNEASKSTDQAARGIGGGVSKIRQAIDKLRDAFQTVRESARSALQSARDEFARFGRSVADSVMQGFSFATIHAERGGQSFLRALENQARKVADFTVLVNRLIAGGATEAVVQQVLGAGVDAGSQIASEILNTVGGISTANELVATTQTLANQVGQNAASSFRQAGVDTATALVQGIESVIKRYRIRLRSNGLTERQLRNLQRNFETEVAFRFTTGGFEIPALAEGGIVRSPTLALIGEAGPEAVVPLNRNNGIAGDTYVTINVQGGDPQAVVNALVRWSRQNGPLPSSIRVS